MPVVAVAVCPHPPVLVPEIAGAAAEELDGLRTACDRAVRSLMISRADAVVLVGSGARTCWIGREGYGSFAPYGVSIEVCLNARRSGSGTVAPGDDRPADGGGRSDRGDGRPAGGTGGARLPLSLTIGAWLLARSGGAGAACPVEAVSVADSASGTECAAVGARLAHRPDRVALLVMGDGSACRGERSPGYADPRAQPYDDRIAEALATADTTALRAVDPVLSAELLVAGRAPWQVLAGATTGDASDGYPRWRAELDYHAAPYGVAYFVATWLRP